MKRMFKLFTVLVAYTLLQACASVSSHIREVPPEKQIVNPDPGKSMIIFMRPSLFGGGIQATVFDGKEYISTVSAGTRIAYQTNPGKHMFMVIGESADFMRAELLPNKTYYSLVTPRFGVWKARFSFEPINIGVKQSQLQEYLDETKLYEPAGAAGQQWARENSTSIDEKHSEYLQKWNSKHEKDKQTLQMGSYRSFP